MGGGWRGGVVDGGDGEGEMREEGERGSGPAAPREMGRARAYVCTPGLWRALFLFLVALFCVSCHSILRMRSLSRCVVCYSEGALQPVPLLDLGEGRHRRGVDLRGRWRKQGRKGDSEREIGRKGDREWEVER